MASSSLLIALSCTWCACRFVPSMVLQVNESTMLVALRNIAWFRAYHAPTHPIYVWLGVLDHPMMYYSNHVMCKFHFVLAIVDLLSLFRLLLRFSIHDSCQHLIWRWCGAGVGMSGSFGRYKDTSAYLPFPVYDRIQKHGAYINCDILWRCR